MFFSQNKLIMKSVYKLKIISLLLLVINIFGCQLPSDEIYARESQGESSISSMNQAQIDYLVEKNRFAKTFDELQINISPESSNYIFKIIPQPSNTKSVMHTAQAKRQNFHYPNLKNFMGVVYLVGNSDDGIIITQFCETTQDLSVPPKMLKLAKEFDKIECPSGFQLSGSSSQSIKSKKENKY